MAKIELISFVKSFWKKTKNFAKENPLEFFLLLVVLIVGAFFRLYKINEYMTFLGDEGRDVIIVRNLLVKADPILIGPGTSIGQMYLGPLYYYMMAPALLLANYSPVGPAVMVALLGVATIFFIWYILHEWFSSIPALMAAALYAVSPTAIIFAKSSWNPNIMPFFALLTIWSIWKAWTDKNYKWLVTLGVAFAFVLQSHYLGLLLFPVIFIVGFLICKKANEEKKGKLLSKYVVLGILIFLFLMSPLLIFDLRHNFQNFKALREFLAHNDSSFKGIDEALGNISMVYTNLFTRLLTGRNATIGQLSAIGSALFLVVLTIKRKLRRFHLLLICWLVFGVVGLAFVQREIFDHYMGFLFPLPFLIFGALIYQLLQNKRLIKFGEVVVVVIFAGLLLVNLAQSPLQYSPNRQLQRSMEVSQKMLDETNSKRFNLAVLAERNYEDGYRYFLEVAGIEVLHADIWDRKTISDELFVVCEKPRETCDPTHDSKAEIVNFGWTKIDNEWNVGGVVLYKLGHAN